MMVLVGLSLLGKIKFLTILNIVVQNHLLSKTFKALLGSDSLFSFYLLGMLNGLLPCGLYMFLQSQLQVQEVHFGVLL